MTKKKVAVIGAGFAGLSISALLSKNGYDVTVFEKHPIPGGRARIWKKSGFTFDMGPSWYLMPDIFENFFKLFGKKVSDYYLLERLNPAYRIFFSPSDIVDISSKLIKNLQLFNKIEEGGGKKLESYLKQSKYQYEISMKQFIYKGYKSIFDFLNWTTFVQGSKLNIFENMDKHVARFFNSDRLKKIMQYNLVFLGGSPSNTPAIYALMAHLDFNLGVWYPKGGIYKVVQALYSLALAQGVKFKFNQNVIKINISDEKATQIVTNKKSFDFDIIVSSADYHFTETRLLSKASQSYPQSYWDKKTIAPSAFIIYLGLSKKIKNLTHHNLFLTDDWTKHFESIFKNPGWFKDPSFYICVPSKTDSFVSPKRCENLFVLVPVAPGLKDSKKVRQKYFDMVIHRLENLLGENIKNSIMVKRIYAHQDFINDYNAYKGSALGLAQTLFQTSIFRPRHQSKKVKNLYYTGQYTHPGIGMPICLISSQIVSKIIINNDNSANY